MASELTKNVTTHRPFHWADSQPNQTMVPVGPANGTTSPKTATPASTEKKPPRSKAESALDASANGKTQSSGNLSTKGPVSIDWECLLGMREMLVAQQALQRELQLRWSSMVKGDDELLSGLANFQAKTVVSLDEQEDWPKEILIEEKAEPVQVEHSFREGVEEIIAKVETKVESTIEAVERGLSRAASDISRSTGVHTNSAVMELAEVFQRERERQIEEQSLKWAQSRAWVRVVNSDRFDLCIGCVIIVNTLFMLVNLELQGHHLKKDLIGISGCTRSPCDDDHAGAWLFAAVEQIFTAIFLIEIVLRLVANGITFLYDVVHFLDFLIVLISVVDLWVVVPLGDGNSSGAPVLRVARLARLAKVFRVVRVLRAFEPLRILVTTVVNSIGALLWSMTLLFVFELIGSIFLAQLLQPYISDPAMDPEIRLKVWKSFGTWSRSMNTAYEITMAPGGFLQYRQIIEEVSPMVGLFFIFYNCTVTFAVIRVITALFLRATLAVCDREDYEEGQRASSRRSAFAKKLHQSIDNDGTGGIDYEEFMVLIDIPQMKEWLADAGLLHESALRLFRALVDPQTGKMKFDEFMHALAQMGGPPRACDLVVISYETRKVLGHTAALMEHHQIEDAPRCQWVSHHA